MNKLNELSDLDSIVTAYPEPIWAKNITKEKKHALYLQVKASIPHRRQFCDVTLLEEAVAIYEKNNGIA